MKKAFALLAAALIGAPAVLHAQDDASVRFGIRLAPNMSWLRPDTRGVESNGNILGFTFGLLTEFPVGNTGNYQFATGLFLNNVGGGYTYDFTFVENVGQADQVKALTTDIALRYVEVPFTIKMMTNEIGYMRYFGQLGISAGFNIRAKADVEVPLVDANLNNGTPVARGFQILEGEDISDDINLFRAALVVGGGVEYNISGNTNLMVGITYNNGLTNINRREIYDNKKAKIANDYLELTLGVFF